MPHKTRRLLASICKSLKSGVDKHYNDLRSKIKNREISTQQLWDKNFFDVESLLKFHNPALNTEPYPECRENGFYLHDAEVPQSELGASNAYLLLQETVDLDRHQQLEITVKRFCIHFGEQIIRTDDLIALVVLEWMLAENVNILSKYKFQINLMHIAVTSCNYRAVERLLQIEPEHVVHELLHSTDCYRLLPHHLVKDVDWALPLYPQNDIESSFAGMLGLILTQEKIACAQS